MYICPMCLGVRQRFPPELTILRRYMELDTVRCIDSSVLMVEGIPDLNPLRQLGCWLQPVRFRPLWAVKRP